MSEIELRLSKLLETANKTGITIDALEWITQDLSLQAALKVMGRASSMPSYMKSNDKPNILRNASAPSSDTR